MSDLLSVQENASLDLITNEESGRPRQTARLLSIKLISMRTLVIMLWVSFIGALSR